VRFQYARFSSLATTNKQRVRRKPKISSKRGMEKDFPSDRTAGLAAGFRVPKPFIVTPIYFRKIRFVLSAAIASQAFTASTMLDLQLQTFSNTVGYRIARAIKLKYVEIWEPFNGVGAGVLTNSGLRWDVPTTANLPTSSETLYASSVMPDAPAHLLARPTRDTYPDWWHNAADNGPMFTLLSLSANAIVDIAFLWVTYESGNSTASTTAINGAIGFPGYNAIHSPNVNMTALGLADV
jgi:hypothetical protein